MNEDCMISATCNNVLINQDSTPEFSSSSIVLAIKIPILDQIDPLFIQPIETRSRSDFFSLHIP